MNRSYIVAAAVLGIAVLWITSGQIGRDSDAGARSAADTEPSDSRLQRVRVSSIEATPMMAEVIIPGRTQAFRTVDVRSQVRGPVGKILIARGQPVKEGDVILGIDPQARQEKLAEARAKVAQRTMEFDAASKLEDRGFSSRVRLNEARAMLEEARAELRQAELDVMNLEIRAPFDGILEDRPAEVGDFLEVGGLAARVVDLDPIRVVAYAAERDVAMLDRGAKGHTRLIDGTVVEGTISYVAATAETNTRTFRVEMEVPNPDSRIVDGVTAELRLPIAQKLAHKVMPSVLTLADSGAIGVKIVDSDDVVRFVPATILGSAPDGGVWLGGLPDRITLITVGQDFVAEGQKVVPVPAGAA